MEIINYIGRHLGSIVSFLGILATFIAGCWGAYIKLKPFIKFVKRLIYELSDNGGGSMKDKINKAVTLIQETSTKVDALVGWRMALFYENPIPMFLNNEKGICIDVNKAWIKLTGLQKDLAVGHGWEKILFHEDLERINDEGKDFINDGNSFESSFRVSHYETKEVINVYCTATKVLDSKGNLLSVIGTLKRV